MKYDLVILLHGFNVRDGGKGTVGRLRSFFANEGIPYLLVNYGWFGIAQVIFKNNKIAKRLSIAIKSAKLQNKDAKICVVGHSNGCAIMHIACKKYGTPIDKAVYIHPALDSDTVRPFTMRSLDVWYSPSDKPVKWAKMLPWSLWGAMGATGYTGIPDDMTRSFDQENDYPVSSEGHSDSFLLEDLPFFGPEIVKEAMRDIVIK